MIIIENVSKSYGQQNVLTNLNIRLPRNGLVVFEGPSGCGKTTLLNLLSGLLDFEGDIIIDGRSLQQMPQKVKDDMRFKSYGFIFQDFKLFESENVFHNIVFPLDAASNLSQETKIRKCKELLKLVGLKEKLKQKVNKLSGGEKQRVAIARALVNNPKIVLADEPTGALDSKTSKEIMDILEFVSKKSLVVMVSHDKELAEKYADQIIELKDGSIQNVRIINKEPDETKNIRLAKLRYSEKKTSIPSSFLLHHTFSSIKQKKWRTSICNFVTSLGLIGVGLATSLSSTISNNIKQSYSKIIDDSKITISLKNEEKTIYGQYATNYFEVMDIANKYKKYVYDVGVTYLNSFENFFPHTNCIALADSNYYSPIEGISARHINEFRWLDVECTETIYPEKIDYLENDEVVLSLTIDMIYDICFQLKIERTVTSLSHYLQKNKLRMYFDLRNDNWQYSDQQIFTVVGFSLEKQPGIYHLNHMWNEYMFETRMRFPTTDDLNGNQNVPWYLKKIYYIYSNDKRDEFLSSVRFDRDLEPYIFEIANATYYPWLYRDIRAKDVQRVLVFSNSLNMMPAWYYQLFQEIDTSITNPIFGTNYGYSIYPSNMMYGFASIMYFSSSIDSLDETIDIATNYSLDIYEDYSLPDDVLSGHFSQSLLGGMNFKVIDSDISKGRSPKDISEIIISSEVEKTIFDGDALNKNLEVAYLAYQSYDGNGNILKRFQTTSLVVVGVIESDGNYIYHFDDWSIGFFQTMLDVSAFNLGINTIMVEVKEVKRIPEIIKKLKRAFPDLIIENPMDDVNKSVNQICAYIEIALSCFSIISVVISTMLLSICNYLYILENKKDIGLVRCMGVTNKEAKKFVVTHSTIMCFISFCLSSIELFLITLVINGEMSKIMESEFAFSFNFMSLAYMFLLSFFVSIISALSISHKIGKLDPIAALKS